MNTNSIPCAATTLSPAGRPADRHRLHTAIRRALAGSLATSLLLGSAAAHADAASGGAASDGVATLDEVVVTANKRSENTRDVPVSIGVVDSSAIDALHIEGYEDITRLVPGVSFAAHNGPGQDNISIRGVSSTVGNPTVGFYVDEVPIITNNGYEGAAQPKLLDIDRIEVLRGPQGTLYGASSEGGTIRFITGQPNLESFSGNVASEVSNTNHGGVGYDISGTVNVPVVDDVFGLRISGDYDKTSGYIDRYSLGGALLKRGVNSQIDRVLNIKGLIQLPGDFTITPSVLYQNITAADSPTFIPELGLYKQNKQVIEYNHDRLFIPSITARKSFGAADLTSITSYVRRSVDRQADGTFFNSAAIAQFFLNPAYPEFQTQNDTILANVASPVLFTDRFNTWSQEFRLQSASDTARLKWVVGVFASDQEWSHLDYETMPGFSAAFRQIYGYDINTDPVLNGTGIPNLFANDLVWTVNDHNDVRQAAVFGQVDYAVTDKLRVAVGERFVKATERFSETGGGFFDVGGAGTDGTPYRQKAKFSASTPKLSLTYEVTPESSLYAAAAKGFRLGGATTPNTNAACVLGLQQLGYNSTPTDYDSDQLWSYEVGSKSLLFNKSLSVNASAYYIDWKRIQQTIIIPICGGAFNANVGDAEAYGGELEVRYRPPALSGLTVSLNFGAEHAQITRTIDPNTAAVGQDVLFTPKMTASLLAEYAWRVSDTMGAFVRGDYEYTGESKGSFQVTSSQYINPSYDVVNLNAGVTVGSLEVSLYAKNLLDKKTILQRPQINTVIEGYVLRPLTVGLTGRMKF